ncbi:MAG TPA: AI-2E family transporter [Terriglobales bacterium]|nr:AI-2E family transporter [Terriglobales bacterium]
MPEQTTTEPDLVVEQPVSASTRLPEPRVVSAGLRGPHTAGSAITIVTIVAVLAACYFAKLVFVVLLISVLLAFILAPIAELLERQRIPRSISSALAVGLLIAAIFGASYYSYNKAQDLAHELPRYSGRIRATLENFIRQAEDLRKSTADVLPDTNTDSHTQKVVVEQQTNWSEYLTQSFGGVTDVLFALAFIPFLVYFMLSWQEHVRAATVMLFRLENRNTAYVTLGAISKMIRSFIVGNVLVGLFMSVLLLGAFAFVKVPYFYFIAFVSGFLSVIPYLGVILAMLPPLVVGLGHVHASGAIVIVVTVAVIHLFALNVLYPKMIGSRVRLNPLAVTVSLLIWGWLWGAMGLILAVPITAAMKIIFDHVDSLRGYGAWLGE